MGYGESACGRDMRGGGEVGGTVAYWTFVKGLSEQGLAEVLAWWIPGKGVVLNNFLTMACGIPTLWAAVGVRGCGAFLLLTSKNYGKGEL